MDKLPQFKEWLIEAHPLEESWLKNVALGGAMLGTGLGIGSYMNQPSPQAKPAVVQSADPSFGADDHPAMHGGKITGNDAYNQQTPNSKFSRFDQFVKRQDAKRAIQQKGTEKEIKSTSGVTDAATDFLK